MTGFFYRVSYDRLDQGHTSVFLFILTVRVRRFFTFVFSFSCKLLIANGQLLRTCGFQPCFNLPRSRCSLGMPAVALWRRLGRTWPPSLMLSSVFALASCAGHAGWRHVCVFLCVSARRQVRRTGRHPMPQCPPRPSCLSLIARRAEWETPSALPHI